MNSAAIWTLVTNLIPNDLNIWCLDALFHRWLFLQHLQQTLGCSWNNSENLTTKKVISYPRSCTHILASHLLVHNLSRKATLGQLANRIELPLDNSSFMERNTVAHIIDNSAQDVLHHGACFQASRGTSTSGLLVVVGLQTHNVTQTK